MSNRTIGFIGGGRITRIFLQGFATAGVSTNVSVTDTSSDVLSALKCSFPHISTHNDYAGPASSDVVFLAVHPPVIAELLPELASALRPDAVFVSLAPKFTIPKLASGLGGFDRIARMIPNAASVVGAGYNPIAFSPALPESDRASLLSLLSPLGESALVKDENLEAYAIMTAMGPTYLWFQLSELRKLGVRFGLSQAEADAGIKSMVVGAARTLFESGLPEEAVIDLIPVKPIGEDEPGIKAIYNAKLPSLFEKLKS